MASQRKGIVLGVFEGEKDTDFSLSSAAEYFQTNKAKELTNLLKVSGLFEKKGGKSRVFYGLDGEYGSVAVVKVGKKDAGYCPKEERNEGRENVRTAVAAGVKQLQEAGIKNVLVDPCGDPEAAAEGATLSVYYYDELKGEDGKKPAPQLGLYDAFAQDKANVGESWNRGVILGEGQNFARYLMDAPASHMTPTRFAELMQERLGKLDNVTVTVREQDWAESMKMGSFLSVTRGSAQPPKFVEINYKGGQEGAAPFALVGKGITFDAGGISLKPSASMDAMRADMGGAACVVSAMYTAARLKLPLNVMAFTPLCENLPSGTATKPGDVVTAMNGKTIQVDNTDAEGRLVLADALCYAETFKPTGIIDMATLTGAMMVALGAAATGVFTNSTSIWENMHEAGKYTGDRVWRMPVFKLYTKQMTESALADLNNIGSGSRAGGASTAAAFLKEFVTTEEWMHMDIAGVMSNTNEVPYLCKGMAGRPTRTVVEFLNRISKK
eukprot:GHVU01120032.1.p1 GENE.GHVU01120032.1~~GHVU01120032.1.p1  ORF type:complete len:521 (+),score=90.29 GHVU01120032.1:75-1565(+)